MMCCKGPLTRTLVGRKLVPYLCKELILTLLVFLMCYSLFNKVDTNGTYY